MDAKETPLYLIILTVVAGIGFVLIYFFTVLIRQQRHLKQMHLESMQNILNVIESERKRISNDLHDEVHPLLATIKHQMESLSGATTHQQARFATSIQLLDDVMISLRAISNDLMPVMLMRNKLMAAIRQYIGSINQRRELHIEFSTNIENDIDQEISVHLFRIIQEAVHNTIKHAFARNMHIRLNSDQHFLTLHIDDDGKGFPIGETQVQLEGRGIPNIQFRVHLMSGDCRIHAEMNKGTSYVIKLPYIYHDPLKALI